MSVESFLQIPVKCEFARVLFYCFNNFSGKYRIKSSVFIWHLEKAPLTEKRAEEHRSRRYPLVSSCVTFVAFAGTAGTFEALQKLLHSGQFAVGQFFFYLSVIFFNLSSGQWHRLSRSTIFRRVNFVVSSRKINF